MPFSDAQPIQRNKFNSTLRDGLRQALALSSIDPALIDAVVDHIFAKSIRSGAITEVITDGTADFVAADFAGHTNSVTTQSYSHTTTRPATLKASLPRRP